MIMYVGKQQKLNGWELDRRFREGGPFFHLYTKPLESGVIFMDDIERAVALVYIAIAAEWAGVEILAYALMSNHFHFILCGQQDQCLAFFRCFEPILSRYFSRHGRPGVLKKVKPELQSITTLKQLRDEIAYVIRNPFVVRPDINLFAYPWCSGFLYFNPMLEWIMTEPADRLTVQEKRALTHTRAAYVPKGLTLVDGMAFPGSFVNYALVESMFESARQFSFWVLKNIESQVETALRFDEKPFLTDDEMLSVSLRLCRDKYGEKGPSSLTEEQKFSLARQLKNEYYASNKQIARFSCLPLRTLDELFPLSAKDSSTK